MSYDKNQPLNQGATKASEIAVDRSQSLFDSAEGANLLKILEQHIKTSLDLLRRQNYILRSTGNIIWDGSAIKFDYAAAPQDIAFEILHSDDPTQRKATLWMRGVVGPNEVDKFNEIQVADNELVYLELESSKVMGGTPGSEVIYYTDNIGIGINYSPSTDREAQSFTVVNAGFVDQITVRVRRNGANLSGNLQLELREDNAGEPGALIATSNNTVAVGGISIAPAYDQPSFDFAGAPVSAGTKYWIVAKYSSMVEGGDGITFLGSDGAADNYAGGEHKYYTGGSWGFRNGDPDYDLHFQVDIDTGVPSDLDLQNAVGGGSLATGMTIKKVLLSDVSGLPQIKNPITGTPTTMYIPLALRKGTQLFWIPHGIMWPENTISPLGAVIVSGLEAWPEYFVSSQSELVSVLSALGGGEGAVILVTGPLTIDQTITLPDNVKLLSRGMNKNEITMAVGGQIRLGARSSLQGLFIKAAPLFTGAMVTTLTNDMSRIENCRFDISATPDVVFNKCIEVNGSHHRIKDCWFNGVDGTNRVDIDYLGGSNNKDENCVFDTSFKIPGAKLKKITLTSTGTWVPPAYLIGQQVLVEGCGGGGGGGGGQSVSESNGRGGGGGAGAPIFMYPYAITGNVYCFIGNGGNGGTQNVNGSDGTASAFGALFFPGGAGGISGNGGSAGGAGYGHPAMDGDGGNGGGVGAAGQAGRRSTIWPFTSSGGIAGPASNPGGGGGGGGSSFDPGGNAGRGLASGDWTASPANGSSAGANTGAGGGGGGGCSASVGFGLAAGTGGNGGSGRINIYYIENE